MTSILMFLHLVQPKNRRKLKVANESSMAARKFYGETCALFGRAKYCSFSWFIIKDLMPMVAFMESVTLHYLLQTVFDTSVITSYSHIR